MNFVWPRSELPTCTLRQNYLVGLRTKVRCGKSFVVHQALSASFRDEASHFKHVTMSRYL
jgi:hypothetical protein